MAVCFSTMAQNGLENIKPLRKDVVVGSKAKPATKVKATEKKADTVSEGKALEKKPTATKATEKPNAEK